MNQDTQSIDPGRIWPTVEQQLIASKVIFGSALEALVRAHQDLHILRPEEAHDQLQIPPWLRVYWRKKHPNAKYFGPSGGYPLVLERLYDWMVAHQDLTGLDVSDAPVAPLQGGSRGK